jgi:hypothetical protein
MTLKDQIADEIVHGKQIGNHNIVACRSCGYTYVYKGRQGELNGNFCSLRCQAWYDDGNPQLPSDLAVEALTQAESDAESFQLFVLRPALTYQATRKYQHSTTANPKTTSNGRDL